VPVTGHHLRFEGARGSVNRRVGTVLQRGTITATSEGGGTRDLAGRLWFTGPDGPYTPEQWKASLLLLLLRSANKCTKALYGCNAQPPQE
jgi:hypothetical protein